MTERSSDFQQKPVETTTEDDPRITFVTERLGDRRKNYLVLNHGSERGRELFEAEVAFIGEVVRYLDTPPRQRIVGTKFFEADITKRAKDAGVNQVVPRGKQMYRYLVEARISDQLIGRGGYLTGHGADPQAYLRDGTHRKAAPENR